MVPPIGEAYLAAYLSSKGHNIKILDLTLSNNFKADVEEAIYNFNPEVIGVSIRNIDSTTYPGNLFFYLPVKKVVEFIKEIAEPEISVILGGAGFSIFSEEILRDLNHDIGVFGEGEYVFQEILKKVKNDEDIREIERGICFITEDGQYHQKPPWIVKNLDDLPFPERELIDNEAYLIDPLYDSGPVWANVQTKRGCSKNCIYCSYKYIEGPSVRYRSSELIAKELDFIRNNINIKNIFFVDSLFNLNYTYTKRVCQEIIDHNIDVLWGANYAPSTKFIDLLPLMKESGATHLASGFESLSGEMLKNMKKGRNPNDAILTSEKCSELEIEQLIHMIVGGPGETLETVRASFDQLENLHNHNGHAWQGDGDVMMFVGLRIYPHTELQTIAEQQGVIQAGENLLTPKFYIDPKLKEAELFKVIREYCNKNPRWMVPGLGLNNPKGFGEMSQLQFQLYQK
jgi:radical SAM superfamily enzyme YgiQ (UPF0313 family)